MDSQGELNPTQGALLGLLREHASPSGELTGGELVRIAKLVIGEYWTLTRSQVYRELATLAERGLLAAGEPRAREARPFRLTVSGEAAFLEWVDREPGEDTVRLPILLSVLFGPSLEPGRLAEILDAYGRRHREKLEQYRSLLTKLDGQEVNAFALATLNFGIEHEQAVLRWLEGLPAELRR